MADVRMHLAVSHFRLIKGYIDNEIVQFGQVNRSLQISRVLNISKDSECKGDNMTKLL